MKGLIIGKFWPLHAGHLHLIRTASEQCETVDVLAFSSSWEDIPLEDRLRAIQTCSPVNVRAAGQSDVLSDPYDEETWQYWVDLIGKLAPEADTLFSSEAYGDELALRLGIRHVMVDLARSQVPASGTLIRLDPMTHWELIAPPLRKFYTRKVVLVGAESTGKSTLALQLAKEFQTVVAEEMGRTFVEERKAGTGKAVCTYDDLLEIAHLQIAEEERKLAEANRVLICDTDLMVTAAFAKYYFAKEHPEVIRLANERAKSYSLHLLCSTDNPWIDDGTRDCSQADREWFNARYLAEMRWRKQAFAELPAGYEAMARVAVAKVNEILAVR